jgi:hypothetical protein
MSNIQKSFGDKILFISIEQDQSGLEKLCSSI